MAVSWLCECNSWEPCSESVMIPDDLAVKLTPAGRVFLIVDGCHNGPDPTDILEKEFVGYSLYREE